MLYKVRFVYVGTCESASVWMRLCIWGCGVGGGGQTEDWGVIQSLHKWIWLIEGASDPDWCTAGAPLIGEGGEWRREWREKRKREYGPQRKCTSAVTLLTRQGSCQTLIPVKKVTSLKESHIDAHRSSVFIFSP